MRSMGWVSSRVFLALMPSFSATLLLRYPFSYFVPMSINPARFLRQVKQEVSKVVWPTRQETISAVVMVFVMVAVMAVFFLLVDQVIAWGVSEVLG